MAINKIKGTRDYYGEEAKKLNYFFKTLDKIATKFGYQKIFTPTMEETSLFSRTVGNKTDVINKEMYSFNDRKERSISLRPEGTAQTVRMALENKLLDNNLNPNLYYIGNMFRYERPQKGRQREFFQFGVENFGNKDFYVDAEIVLLAKNILNEFFIDKVQLLINTIGTSEDRIKFNEELRIFITKRIDDFSEYAKDKIKNGNVLRVLDSKDKRDQEMLKLAPKLIDFINEESLEYYKNFKRILEKNNISYIEDGNLVRGLDYYNDIVFEFVSTDIDRLGAKSTLIGGGRYDGLVKQLELSKDIPAVGFAMGIERMLLACEDKIKEKGIISYDYYIATAYAETDMKDAAIKISSSLRSKGFKVYVDFEDKKLPKKLDNAKKKNSTFVIIVGNEVKANKVTIKEIGTQELEIKEIEEI